MSLPSAWLTHLLSLSLEDVYRPTNLGLSLHAVWMPFFSAELRLITNFAVDYKDDEFEDKKILAKFIDLPGSPARAIKG